MSAISAGLAAMRRNFASEDDRRGWMRAALEGRTEIINALLAKGTDVNEQDNCGRTALMFAAINLHRDTVLTLLEGGADVNITADDGATALMLAACVGDIEIVRALLARGADVQRKFISTGRNAAMLAAEKGFYEIVQLLNGTEDRANLLDGSYTTFSSTDEEKQSGASQRVEPVHQRGVQRENKTHSR